MLYLFKVDNKTPKEHSICFYWYGYFKDVFKTQSNIYDGTFLWK